MPQPPSMPTEPAQMKQPDMGDIQSTQGRRTTDKFRSGSQTILTNQGGPLNTAPIQTKTLLGQ